LLPCGNSKGSRTGVDVEIYNVDSDNNRVRQGSASPDDRHRVSL
jgi:hypothetical protein